MKPTSRVALVHCTSYDSDHVYQAIGRGLGLLGGANQFVQPGEKILLKPNMLKGTPPESAATTHPVIVQTVARHLLDAGANLTYGDSPGIGRPADVARRAGYTAVAQDLGIALADFVTPVTVSFHDGALVKQLTIAQGVHEADGLISLPKLKTHGFTRITGAIKNQYGCIPGLLKAEFHARLPEVERFSQMLVDLNRMLAPRLYVMDAIVGMEGNGPGSGDPRKIGALLLSTDPIALDATACRLINLDPSLVPTNVAGEAIGFGTTSDIELLGDPIEPLILTDYAANRSSFMGRTMRGRLGSLAKQYVVPRPVVLREKCIECGICVDACPIEPKAIDFAYGRKRPPVHDYQTCIRCYCCQEMCPQRAIVIKTPLLGRLFRRG